MNDSLATVVAGYLAHKRALGRKFDTEEATLRLLLTFSGQHAVQGMGQLTPALFDAFVASRPRKRARSFNHLVGVVCCFLDWAVAQQRLEASPLRRTRRHETDVRLPFLFDVGQARRLLDAAAYATLSRWGAVAEHRRLGEVEREDAAEAGRCGLDAQLRSDAGQAVAHAGAEAVRALVEVGVRRQVVGEARASGP
jgi:hypothetical protein